MMKIIQLPLGILMMIMNKNVEIVHLVMTKLIYYEIYYNVVNVHIYKMIYNIIILAMTNVFHNVLKINNLSLK